MIRDGQIVEVGPTRRVENLSTAREAVEINAAGRVVLPGFVDCHTHLVFPPGGVSDEDDRATRIVRTSTARRLIFRARAYLEAMARHGTTTVEVKTGCGPDECAETKIMRVLSCLRYNPVDLVSSFLFRLPATLNGSAGTAADHMLSALLPKIRKRKMAQFADLAWDTDPKLAPYFERYLATAKELGFRCKIHADQEEPERAIELALRHQVASVDHLEYVSEAGAAALAGSGIIATLLPCAAFSNGRAAPARALIEAGVPVALASNFNPHHTPTLNMQGVVTMACWRFGMTIAEALNASTFNGAHALGCGDRVGSIEPGKSADLVLLNTGDYRDLAANLGTNLVHLTMKRGKVIYREGVVASLAPEALLD